jgi:hypothetical protein
LALAETPTCSSELRWRIGDKKLAQGGTLSRISQAAFGIQQNSAEMAAAALLAAVDRNQLRRVPILLLQPR